MRRLLVVLLLAGACAPLAFSVDPQFVPSEQDEIHRAAADWNARTNEHHQITFDGANWRILKQDPDSGYNGKTDGRARVIQIHPDSAARGVPVYAVALHEFGHSLGLQHTQTGVMMPFTVSTEFTPEVLEECRRVKACD